MKRYRLLMLSLLILGLAGCAAGAGADRGQAPRQQGNQILFEEIERTQAQNAFDLIRALRPNWLQSRGQHSLTNPTAGQVVIYLDGTRMGGPENLRQILAADVQSARFLSATEASSRYGLDHTGGAIVITTRRR